MSTASHCLVVGVGPGLGMGCVRRFAADGYRVSMIARHAGRLESWEAEVEHGPRHCKPEFADGYGCHANHSQGIKHSMVTWFAQGGRFGPMLR